MEGRGLSQPQQIDVPSRFGKRRRIDQRAPPPLGPSWESFPLTLQCFTAHHPQTYPILPKHHNHINRGSLKVGVRQVEGFEMHRACRKFSRLKNG